MTAPLIYRCHFSRIDGIRWYSLCRARRTHTAIRASCIFRRRPAQQKLDNCIIIRWEGNGERGKERNTERKGEWKSAVTDTRFGDPQKIVSADSLTYQCYRLADSQLFIAHLAMAEDLRSISRWSWIRSLASRGEVRKYADSNDEIFVRIRTMVLASFAGSTRERHAKGTWCTRDVIIVASAFNSTSFRKRSIFVRNFYRRWKYMFKLHSRSVWIIEARDS